MAPRKTRPKARSIGRSVPRTGEAARPAGGGQAKPRRRKSAPRDKVARSPLLEGLGRALRALRRRDGLSRQALAAGSRLSLRFLAQLEAGEGNVSIGKLETLAAAFALSAPALLAAAQGEAAARRGAGESRPALLAELTERLLAAPPHRLEGILHAFEAFSREPFSREAPARPPGARLIVLAGLRGAGKSTLGPLLAERLGLAFIEMDELIEEQSGLALPDIFRMHGAEYYRNAERRALSELIAHKRAAVVAVSGGIVTDPVALGLLRRHTRLIWLKATPEQHMARVEAQGDYRPMHNRPNAMAELKGLLRAREPLYRQAHAIVDTGSGDAQASLAALLAAAEAALPDLQQAR